MIIFLFDAIKTFIVLLPILFFTILLHFFDEIVSLENFTVKIDLLISFFSPYHISFISFAILFSVCRGRVTFSSLPFNSAIASFVFY